MIRHASSKKTDVVRVTFALPLDDPEGPVSVVGDFNEWTPGTHELRRRSNGTRSVAIDVRPGTTVQFRYLGTDGRWFDDPQAQHDGRNCLYQV